MQLGTAVRAMFLGAVGVLSASVALLGGPPGVPCEGGGGTSLDWQGFALPFFEKNCNECHDYERYSEVYDLRNMILDLVLDGNMPPFTRVTAEEKRQLDEWISCGAPRGLETAPFRRGDATGEGLLNVLDAVRILLHLFAGAGGDCLDAMDSNGDRAIDLKDPIFILKYLFLAGPSPPAPFEECGSAPGLGCAASSGCAGG